MKMLQVLFHYSTPRGAVSSQSVVEVDDLPELREYAERFVQTLIAAPALEDWRNWVLHVSDDLGREVFSMPFSTMIGKPH
jgi:hypothetical protein